MTTIPRLASLSLAVPLFLLACATGCAKDQADLRLTCLESKASFTQSFSKAYVSRGAEGNTEIVLVNDAAASGAAGQTLQPDSVRQVMHVKVLWRPQKGAKQGHPSYTNAGIHWYVLNAPAEGKPAEVLEYTGAGFVALSDTLGGDTEVTIRNATLKPVATNRASLNDPIGPAKMTGTFVATKSSQQVENVLTEVQTATGAVAQQASAR